MARRWRIDGGDHETGSMKVTGLGGMVAWTRTGWRACAWDGTVEFEREYSINGLERAKLTIEKWLAKRQEMHGKVPGRSGTRRLGRGSSSRTKGDEQAPHRGRDHRRPATSRRARKHRH